MPSVRKVKSKRERAFDTEFTDADVRPMELHHGSMQSIEPVSFTNIVHSPPSAAPQRGNPRSALVVGLIAAIWRRLVSPRKAKKEPTLLDFARRGKR